MKNNKKALVSLIICFAFFIGVVVTAGVTAAFFGGNAYADLENIRLKNAITVDTSSDAITSSFTALPGEQKEIYLTGSVKTNGSGEAVVGGLVRAKVNLDFDGGVVVGALKLNQDTKVGGTQLYWNLFTDGYYYLVTGSETSTNLFTVTPTTAGVDVTMHFTLSVGTQYDKSQSGKKFNLSHMFTAAQGEVYKDGVLVANTIPNTQHVFEDVMPESDTLVNNTTSNVYTQLEYVESTGSQFINAGVRLKGLTSKVVADLSVTRNNGTSFLFGCYSSGSQNFALNYYLENQSLLIYYTGEAGAPLASGTSADTATGVRHKVCVKPGSVEVNGKTVLTYETADFTTGKDIQIFGSDNRFGMKAKLYSMQIYDGDVLVRNFVPCKSPDGTVGLFDMVSYTFFTNVGSGVFIAGADRF